MENFSVLWTHWCLLSHDIKIVNTRPVFFKSYVKHVYFVYSTQNLIDQTNAALSAVI